MAFGESLYSKLAGDAGVSALVGTRIYPQVFRQQSIWPSLRYVRITSEEFSQMGSDAGVSRVRYQIDCAGETYAEADGLALAVDACLRRWRESGIVQDSYIISVSDLYDEELDIYRVSIDVEFWVIN